mmetsp:Transcript_26250/g.80787  ORF Transcript_26250/g.80787 Transcript_26250/m.80787 type:complete len:119 (+) Transcript_26250:3-359(+)
MVAWKGVSHEETIHDGSNLLVSLLLLKLWGESKTLAHQLLPAARRSMGADHDITLRLTENLAYALQDDPERTRDDLLEAETILQDVVQRRRRVFGPTHPDTPRVENTLSNVRKKLARA